jgi:hypothetical protein
MSVVGVRNVPESTVGLDVFDESLILPLPGTDRNAIVLEERDGPNVVRLRARDIFYSESGKVVLKSLKVDIAVLVTDSRVAFGCTKYDKGGGYWGDPISMAVSNIGSKALAAYRTKGKMLLGQVRYPWLVAVGSTSHVGFGSDETLIFDVQVASGENHRLQLNLRREANAADIAADVARRAARHRLACSPDLQDHQRAEITQLLSAQPLRQEAGKGKKDIYFHRFGSFYYVTEMTARHQPLSEDPSTGAGGGACPTCGDSGEEDGWCKTCGENLRPAVKGRYSRDAAEVRRRWRDAQVGR